MSAGAIAFPKNVCYDGDWKKGACSPRRRTKEGMPVHGLHRKWAGMSILNKAIVLSCTFVLPILLVVGLLVGDFYDYRKKSDDILSEYARCTDYVHRYDRVPDLPAESGSIVIYWIISQFILSYPSFRRISPVITCD